MASSSPLHSTPSPWLADFHIALTSRSDRLYNNGRQQIEVTLVMIPAEGQSISDAQYASAGLMHENDAGEFVTLAHTEQAGGWFYQAEHDERYDYYPSLVNMAVPAVPAETVNTIRWKRLYVHSLAAPGEAIRLYGSIAERPDHVVRTPLPLGTALIAEASPTYAFPEDYLWTRNVRVGDRLFENAPITNDRFILEYALKPKHVDFSTAYFASPASQAQGLIRWDEQQTVDHRATLVGVAFPHSMDIVHAQQVQSDQALHARLAQQTVKLNAGQITVVAQGDDDVSHTLRHAGQAQPLEIEARDRQGALHRLTIDFSTPDERFDLVVKTAPAVDVQDIANITYFKVAGRGLDPDQTTCRLYANGYQQTYIEVILEAVDSRGEYVQLPAAVLNQVTLVDYHSGARLSDAYTVSRVQSPVDKRFIYYQDQRSTGTDLSRPRAMQVLTFFLKTRARQNQRVAARVVIGPDTYHTHDPSLPAGQGSTSAGRSNTSAIIEPREQDYRYVGAQYFTLPRIDAGDNRVSGVVDIDRYDLTLKDNSLHALAYYNFTNTLFWNYVGSNRTYWIYVHALDGAQSATALKQNIRQPLVLGPRGISHFRLVVDRTWIEGETNNSVSYRCEPQDENGNTHEVWVGTADNMNQLSL